MPWHLVHICGFVFYTDQKSDICILIYRCIWSSFERIDFYIWKFTLFFGTVPVYSNNNVKNIVEKADKVKELTQIEQVKSIDEHRAGVGAGRADKSSQ